MFVITSERSAVRFSSTSGKNISTSGWRAVVTLLRGLYLSNTRPIDKSSSVLLAHSSYQECDQCGPIHLITIAQARADWGVSKIVPLLYSITQQRLGRSCPILVWHRGPSAKELALVKSVIRPHVRACHMHKPHKSSCYISKTTGSIVLKFGTYSLSIMYVPLEEWVRWAAKN